MPTSDLVRELVSNGSLLMKRQLALAKVEVRLDGKKGKTSLELLGTAGVIGYAALLLFLTGGALALGEALGRLWAGAVIVAAALLLVGALLASIGWLRRVKRPLARTRNELNKERTWATHQLR